MTNLERSCGAVVFTRRNGTLLFAIVQEMAGIYSFPKGHMEEGETEMETARREIFEETGLRPVFLDGFRREDEYELAEKPGTRKRVTYFLAEFGEEPLIPRQGEISRIRLLPCEEAMACFSHSGRRQVLAEAYDFLTRQAPAENAGGYMVLGYATGKGLDGITQADAQRLTHVNVAFGVIENGLLSMRCLPDLRKQLERVRGLNPRLKIVLSVGGWTAGGFSLMSRTRAGRDAFAVSVRQVLDDYGLDGVDIDWEYPCSDQAGIDCDPSDRENFTFLMEAMRQAAGPDRIVSIAAGGGDYFIRDTEMDKVARICDYVQIMTYDLNCSSHTTRHHTSLYALAGSYPRGNADYCARIFEAGGVPREKMVLGAAFYSRKWTGVRNACHGLLQEAESIGGYGPSYGELAENYIGKNGFVRYWDDTAKAPYLFDGSTFITYEDARSIAEKCAYIRNQGLRGLMYWEHSCDPSGYLLAAIADNLKTGRKAT